MASAARLQRLKKLQERDLNALPDRSLPQEPQPAFSSDEDVSGGVLLQQQSSNHQDFKPPVLPPTAKRPLAAPILAENTDRRFILVQGVESSYNLGSRPKLPVLRPTTTRLPPITLSRGELAPDKCFTPILALSRYPYKFCNNDCMQDIASALFDGGKFWAREWDLYYVWDIAEAKPLILVRESQFEDLLKEINFTLQLSLRITSQQREDGLVSRFPDHQRCRPRYLGRSHSKEEYDIAVDNVPSAMSRLPGEPIPPPMDDHTLEDFKQLMEDLWDIQKAKNKAFKEKKKVERLAKQQVFADQFKRTQRYLGLRPTQEGSNASWLPTAIDISAPAPYPCDRSVVFICVDVESYERAHHKITEVGIATLDTRDLAGVAPGHDGENWRSKIRARHLRIKDHAHLVNSEFVTGCPDRFDFGTSEWVRLKDAPSAVAACFEPPFGARPSEDALVSMLEAINIDKQRNLIFLGHDTLGDVRYLQQLGFDPLTLPNLLEALDTATMYRVWRRDQQLASLGSILYDFDIAGFNLHNAGNDAAFTIQAMLGVCVREASIRGSPGLSATREEEKAAKVAAAQEAATSLAKEAAEGWSDNEEDGDGGAPVPIVINNTPRPALSNSSNAQRPYKGEGRGRGWSRGHGRENLDQNTFSRGATRGYQGQRGRPNHSRGGSELGRSHGHNSGI